MTEKRVEMVTIEYDRQSAVNYAKRWALGRNPKYYDYSNIGGDCTNFASQCVYAGSEVMNYREIYGWYYINANNKSPSWTGVEYFYDFMTSNEGVGPFGKEETLSNLEVGDLIQLGDEDGDFYHTLVLTDIRSDYGERNYFICTHTFDSYQRDLLSYSFYQLRCIHILGVRRY